MEINAICLLSRQDSMKTVQRPYLSVMVLEIEPILGPLRMEAILPGCLMPVTLKGQLDVMSAAWLSIVLMDLRIEWRTPGLFKLTLHSDIPIRSHSVREIADEMEDASIFDVVVWIIPLELV